MACVFSFPYCCTWSSRLLNWNVKSGGSCFRIWGQYGNSAKVALHLFRSVAWISTYSFKIAEWRGLLLINSISDYIIVEKLTPPLNITVNCTEASHRCRISWQPPHTSHVKRSSCFRYEIVIENKVRIIMRFNSILFFSISTHNTIQPCSHPLLLKALMNMESNISSFKNKVQNICEIIVAPTVKNWKKRRYNLAKLNI